MGITADQAVELINLIDASEAAMLEEASFKVLRDVTQETAAYHRRRRATKALFDFIEKITDE
ncbi:hypothetical protein IF157_21350 [Salmonella enterica subsp. enterica serovar Typhimurium]|uniref:Uncharacterized protein n=3 Tax=root TaxID=1 RepID=A0A8E7FWZ9_9CAUD|nr:hypothetical protein [Salmonella enterica]YP_010582383.1 hypothetical protein PF622_gp10 [Salmonella phage vB_STM-ZS]WOZ15076.1 hypothetical protein [Salmonella phage STP-1]EAN1947223.1 hypothetical protein [Salmonella enterica]EHQ2949256.1 hypothetical protein [Salmonella enterica]MBU4707815.1 hypothetical protein [Salmonella enterica subsp. enterica serovar Typhimurium]MBU4712456.1 hypothetical protein [Salmonella enterica subsp. enterica serovar Typhimurium]